jgi:hypothetical protein
MRLLIAALFAAGLAVNPAESHAADKSFVPEINQAIAIMCESDEVYDAVRALCKGQDNFCWAGKTANSCSFNACITNQLEQMGCSERAERIWKKRVQRHIDQGLCWFNCA